MTPEEVLAAYIGLTEQHHVNVGGASGIFYMLPTYFCWKSEWSPFSNTLHEAQVVVEYERRHPGTTLKIGNELTLPTILASIYKEQSE